MFHLGVERMLRIQSIACKALGPGIIRQFTGILEVEPFHDPVAVGFNGSNAQGETL